MQQLILILHVLVAICLIVLILIQHGKGADVGAAFGSGASNTMFGSQGSMSFLGKLTGFLAAIFFITSLALGYFTSHQSAQSNTLQVPGSVTQQTTTPIPSNKK